MFGKPERKSCDWIVVFDDLVLLVEAKAARPVIGVRLGLDDEGADLNKKIGHARDQLIKTARLIRGADPAFSHIPADRPMVGLIVTLEPFHLRQTFRTDMLASEELPITAVWAHDLEGTVAGLQTVPDVGGRLHAALGRLEPAARDLRAAAQELEGRNPLLEAAFQRWVDRGPQSPE